MEQDEIDPNISTEGVVSDQPDAAPLSPGAPDPQTPPANVAPTPTPPTQAKPGAPKPKQIISMPSNEVAKIRKEERDRGRSETEARLLAEAKELGFESIEDMKAAAKKGKKAREEAAKPKLKPKEAEVAVQNEITTLRRKLAVETRRAKHAQRERDRVQVDSDLRIAAIKAGVVDVDYALHLLRREQTGKTADELSGFSEDEFFSGLRKSSPHLFSPEERPVSTGNGAGSKDPTVQPPKPAVVTKKSVDKEVVDARKMPRDQYEARLKELGIANPSVGYSY